MLTVFWISLAAIMWVYFGYPLLLWLGAFGKRKAISRGGALPTLSVIVPAHNEEASIAAKIDNILASDYPPERVEILVGSDGSSDATEEIVRRYEHRGVGLISFPQQQGKSTIQNGLVAASSGEILVFTDADCLFPPTAIAHLVENLADPRVGLATARPKYVNSNETATTESEGLYLRYETWLRAQEGARGSLAMASGSLFAMRRSLWRPLDKNFGDDFALPLRVAQLGFRNVLDDRATATTRLGQNHPRAMLRMKTRIVAKDSRALLAYRRLLNPARHGSVALALWSHKLARWLVLYFLISLALSNLMLLGRPFFRLLLALQAAFYCIALIGLILGRPNLRFPWSVPMSFVVVNFAALHGTLRCIAGRASGKWTPERIAPPMPGQLSAPARELK